MSFKSLETAFRSQRSLKRFRHGHWLISGDGPRSHAIRESRVSALPQGLVTVREKRPISQCYKSAGPMSTEFGREAIF
jgi:hypothetical protein